MNIQDLVEEFRTTMGQEKNPIMSASLVKEEFLEWLEWNECDNYHESVKTDPVDELKELSDLVYVIYGYANARNWDLTEAVKRVHKNNMDRCIQPDGTIKRREDGKIIKNPNAPKVELGDLV